MTSVDDYGSTHTSLKFKKKESVTSMNDYGSIHTSQKFKRRKEKERKHVTKYGRLWFNPYWSKIPIKQTSIRTYKRQKIKSKQITQ